MYSTHDPAHVLRAPPPPPLPLHQLRALYQRFSNVAPGMLKFMTRHQREEKSRELALYGTQV